MLERFVSEHKPPEVVVVADRDEPGGRGAEDLARKLAARVASLRVVVPPAGCKDLRAWVRRRATKQNVDAAVAGATPRCAGLVVRRRSR